MDIGRKLIGVSAVVSAEGKGTVVDLESLVRRLLLFDGVCLAFDSAPRVPDFGAAIRRQKRPGTAA